MTVRLIILLAALTGLTWLVSALSDPTSDPTGGGETVVLGFVILAAHALGLLLAPLGLPMISAHLFLGLGTGPHGLGLVTEDAVEALGLIDEIALALIALTAGGELVIGQIRPLLRSIVTITLAQVVGIAVIVAIIFRAMIGQVPFAAGLSEPEVIAICLLIGVIAVAKSPATTIAIITETRAQGPFTDTVLGVTVLKDVVVILLFTIVLAAAVALTDAAGSDSSGGVSGLAVQLGLSAAAGLLLGLALAPLLARLGRQRSVLIAGVAFGAATVSRPLGLDPLILCIAAGFAVRNFTPRGRELIRGIESISPMVYAVFFTINGADLDLHALRAMGLVAGGLVVTRAAATWASTWAGARFGGGERSVRRLGWMGFIAQAGVTLGLASIVEDQFPTWGAEFKTLVVAVIVVNQLVGPIMFKFAVVRSGEAGRREDS